MARRKAERTEAKLEQAEKRLPSYRKLRMETVSDPATGKARKHLKFEKEAKERKKNIIDRLSIKKNIEDSRHRAIMQVLEENKKMSSMEDNYRELPDVIVRGR